MKRNKKLREGLEARVKAWDSLSVSGFDGPNTKLVRRDGAGTSAFHKPGSMSGRKGFGKRKVVGKR